MASPKWEMTCSRLTTCDSINIDPSSTHPSKALTMTSPLAEPAIRPRGDALAASLAVHPRLDGRRRCHRHAKEMIEARSPGLVVEGCVHVPQRKPRRPRQANRTHGGGQERGSNSDSDSDGGIGTAGQRILEKKKFLSACAVCTEAEAILRRHHPRRASKLVLLGYRLHHQTQRSCTSHLHAQRDDTPVHPETYDALLRVRRVHLKRGHDRGNDATKGQCRFPSCLLSTRRKLNILVCHHHQRKMTLSDIPRGGSATALLGYRHDHYVYLAWDYSKCSRV